MKTEPVMIEKNDFGCELEQARDESLFLLLHTRSLADDLGGARRAEAVPPEVLDGESAVLFRARHVVEDADGQGRVAHGTETQNHHRATDGVDFLLVTVESGVDQFEDLRGQ